MHGRVKIRTTEEQERLKKLERQKKMETYRTSMNTLTEMRRTKCSDRTALDLTANILLRNPDILTVWNYRREILLDMKESMDKDEFQKLLDGDLTMTVQCLKANPKSYGGWHHRMWVLCKMPEPNWEKELVLCNRYLDLDERNFHCWDYRRFITQMSKVPDTSEYEFTMEKINKNFSNYSAWHLRSKLLPKIFPDIGSNLPINEVKHKEELELVQNAAFTDPNDQSAWLYQRWLLGLTEPKTHFVVVQSFEDRLIVALSHCISQNSDANCGAFIKVEVNDEAVTGVWQSSSNQPHSNVWIFKMEQKLTGSDQITLRVEENNLINDEVHLSALSHIQKVPNFMATFSPSLKEVLNDELSSCEQLLELEPDSKWTTLTSLMLMEAVDAAKFEKDIQNRLVKLTEIDPLRCGYYRDLSSKITIQYAVREYYNITNGNNLTVPGFALNNRNLTSLYHMQYLLLVENVDFSCNSLDSEALGNLHCLLNCKRLNLDGNKIRDLRYLPILPKLTYLSVKDNCIEVGSEYLEKFPNLKEVHL